jgi:hypothetical protein
LTILLSFKLQRTLRWGASTKWPHNLD